MTPDIGLVAWPRAALRPLPRLLLIEPRGVMAIWLTRSSENTIEAALLSIWTKTKDVSPFEVSCKPSDALVLLARLNRLLI
jgi:hypothetical protein